MPSMGCPKNIFLPTLKLIARFSAKVVLPVFATPVIKPVEPSGIPFHKYLGSGSLFTLLINSIAEYYIRR